MGMEDRLINQPIKVDEQIDQHLFESLLKWLDTDREQAGSIYENVRIKLINFFEFQGCAYPEELADNTIERGAKNIFKDAIFRPPDPYIFFRGVARFLLLEYWKEKRRESTILEDLPPSNHPTISPAESERQGLARNEKERMLDCLEYCLNNLPAESRDLFIEYNRQEKRDRIDNRMLMAKNIGIDISTLRNRIMRIRLKLQNCVTACSRR